MLMYYKVNMAKTREKQQKIVIYNNKNEFEEPIVRVVKNRFLTAGGIVEEIIIKKQRIIRTS